MTNERFSRTIDDLTFELNRKIKRNSMTFRFCIIIEN